MIDKWGAAAKAKRAVHPDKGGGVLRSILRLPTTADVDSTDLSLGPDPAKVGTSMDELIRTVNGSAARSLGCQAAGRRAAGRRAAGYPAN